MLTFDRTICGDLHEATDREWLETNGLGGYASSTIAGMNTRRYHGLLVASLQPPVERYVLLSKLEETLIVKGERYALSVNRYAGAIHPQGHQYLTGFRLDPFPVFTYEVAGVTLEKRLCLVQGENTLVVQYKLLGTACQLEVLPLIAFRDYHSLTHENETLRVAVEETPGLVSVMPYPDLPRLYLAHNADELVQTGHWYRRFEYEAEAARGLDAHEDLFNPLRLTFSLSARRSASLIASTRAYQAKQAAALLRQPANRQNQTVAITDSNSLSDGSFTNVLRRAANQFLVTRGDHKTIIAGYHWFSDWGRDTMIALPGLTLVTGRFEVARDILLAFAKPTDRGMLPNRFPDRGEEPEYNTVDATLWFFADSDDGEHLF